MTMSGIRALVARHPARAYFALTFALSWGGVLLVIGGPQGMWGVKAENNPLFALVLVAMVAGPSVSGVLLTALLDGREGVRGLLIRLLRWRVGVRWYATGLLAAPLAAAAVTSVLALVSPEFLPGIAVADDRLGLVLLGVAVGLTAGVFEEIGWTGFAVPHLRRRHGVVATGLIVGVLWSAWHLLVVIWGIGDRAGTVPLSVFLIVDGLAGLPAFRVLMVFVYDRTDSLLLGILMHVSITAATLLLTPRTTGWHLLLHGVLFAAAVWGVAGAAAIAVQHRAGLAEDELGATRGTAR
jgi:membrane protease YdiL (CAAX protease family)